MSNENFINSVNNAEMTILERLVTNMGTACTLVEGDAKTNCPIDMGLLRSSMFSQVVIQGTQVIGRVGNSCEYAPYVHQGTGLYAINGDGRQTPWGYMVMAGKYRGFHWTHGQKPKPFLENARTRNKEKISMILGGA